jgi:hypothetical protein
VPRLAAQEEPGDLQQYREAEDPDRCVAERGGEVVALAPEADDQRQRDQRAADDRDRYRVGSDPGAEPGDGACGGPGREGR